MNIYYSDDEMRKQAAHLVGKLVVTGQESVQGSARGMREDVYKKHISADKVPERLPYAIQTALVELRGWKRFELNSVPKLPGDHWNFVLVIMKVERNTDGQVLCFRFMTG
jgi:hypothetical protein